MVCSPGVQKEAKKRLSRIPRLQHKSERGRRPAQLFQICLDLAYKHTHTFQRIRRDVEDWIGPDNERQQQHKTVGQPRTVISIYLTTYTSSSPPSHQQNRQHLRNIWKRTRRTFALGNTKQPLARGTRRSRRQVVRRKSKTHTHIFPPKLLTASRNPTFMKS